MPAPIEMTFTLKRSPDDAPQFSQEHQASIAAVFAAFRNEGLDIRATAFAMDAVDSAGGATGDFLALAKALGPPIVAALTGWLAGRSGRKVRVKVGDIEAEAHSVKELDKILARIATIAHDNSPQE